jgi:hypothetical protein
MTCPSLGANRDATRSLFLTVLAAALLVVAGALVVALLLAATATTGRDQRPQQLKLAVMVGLTGELPTCNVPR